MAEERNLNGKIVFMCEECGYFYKDKKWAGKCQAWCKKHKSCNLEITKHATKMKG